MMIDMSPAFRYASQQSSELLRGWQRQTSADDTHGGKVTHTIWTDPATGLLVTKHEREFVNFAAFDCFFELENTGQQDTPILEDVQALDWSIQMPANARARLHHANGSLCRMDDFLPQETELHAGIDKTFAPQGGRSSNGVLPFMNLQHGQGGLIIGIGWSGQWAARFQRDKERLRIVIGQEKTHLRLRPGEKIRTPRVLLMPWSGTDPEIGTNLLRRLLLEHYLPRVDGELACPPIAQCLQFHYYLTGQAGEHLEMKALPRVAELGADTFWIDALWYGRQGRDWWQEVGSWVISPDRFPRGLKPIVDAAHEKSLKFVLWFEPERVRKDSILAQEHPEFLLKSPHDADNLLLNLGDEAARRHIAELLSGLISQTGLDVYRQDFNFDPLPYWRAVDEACPDRVGMTENLYIQGLYALWDELRQRHPNIWIDNCASGGRRIDLETLSRSLPLWPSDFSDVVGLNFGMGLHTGAQCMSAGLGRWVPLAGGGIWNFSPYSTRSLLAAGFTFGCHIPFESYLTGQETEAPDFKKVLGAGKTLLGEDFPMALAAAAIAERKGLQPYVTGELHLLLPLTASAHDWAAWQLHRPDEKDGVAVFLRRHESPFEQMQASLRWIKPEADYLVSLSPTYTVGPERVMSGATLAVIMIEIHDQPGSLLVRYREI